MSVFNGTERDNEARENNYNKEKAKSSTLGLAAAVPNVPESGDVLVQPPCQLLSSELEEGPPEHSTSAWNIEQVPRVRTKTTAANVVKDNDAEGDRGRQPLSLEEREVEEPIDIEHVYVEDDPRQWSRKRKLLTLAAIAGGALIGTIGVNIYSPAIPDIQRELGTSTSLISLSVSLPILLQGLCPILWSPLSEFHGRKPIYLISLSIYIMGSGVAGVARRSSVLIGMRLVQALGSSAVSNIGASTLADIFEPHERGTMVGIYYVAPLLGPAIGPLAGGVLTQLLSWRSTFYFLCILAGIILLMLALLKESWRKERSLAYQGALKGRRRDADQAHVQQLEITRAQQSEQVARSCVGTEAIPTSQLAPPHEPPLDLASPTPTSGVLLSPPIELDTGSATPHPPRLEDTKLSWGDLNPFSPIIHIVRQLNNLCVLTANALLYGFTYSITYTSVLTLDAPPYKYDAFKVGFILLSLGIGSVSGSILGGRWSDHTRARLKSKNGKVDSEDRLHSTKVVMCVLPPWVVAYAWMCQEGVNVAGIILSLFVAGFSTAWMYSATLAYIVDGNSGRSSSAVACNSCFRGTMAFVAAEVAVPLRTAIGDGGLYTLWAGLIVGSDLLIMLTMWRGAQWREREHCREAKRLEREQQIG